MLTLNGITPVLAACFTEDESCDDESLCRQIDACISAGAAAVCGPAFGSEFYKLSDTERCHFIDVLIEHTRKRVPVIAVPNSGSIRSTIEMARFAQSRGADCLMVAAPRAVPLPVSSLIEYYDAVCAAVSVPIMLQDADWNGTGLPIDLFVVLAETHANFRFAKLETALPGTKCAAIASRTKEQVGVVYGFGGIAMLDGLAHGACAFMPGAACVEVYARVYSLFKAGEKEEATALFFRLLPYLSFALQHIELIIQMDKRVLERKGVISSSRMRRPTITLDSKYQEQIEDLVDSVVKLCEEIRQVSAVPVPESSKRSF
jgi:4-hydroxy-tetrahydrodipicolinate synthase